jgi:hypothetical protein
MTRTGNKSFMIGVSGWFNLGSLTSGQSGTLLGLGSSLLTTTGYPLLNVSNASASGLNLQFVTNLNSPTSTPVNFGIAFNTYYWLNIYYSVYQPDATAADTVVLLTAKVNDAVVVANQPVSWTSDLLNATQTVNRIKFYGSSNISYFWDDFIVQAVSANDTTWTFGTTTPLTPDMITVLPSRRIYEFAASANGSFTQMTSSSSSLQNWQAATDKTGANYVTATETGQVDTYKWVAPKNGSGTTLNPTDVSAVVMRGNAQRYQNLRAVYSNGTTVTQMPINGSGPSEYVSVAETQGGTQWTAASIVAAEFGQTSL